MTQRAGPAVGGVGRVGVSGRFLLLSQLALLPNPGEWKACSHQAASTEVKGKPFLGGNFLNLGSPQTLGGIATHIIWLLLKAQTKRFFFKDCPQTAEPKG